ncbi:MAG: hypothetical protein AAGH99_14485 [Planctomycetota bacterium]
MPGLARAEVEPGAFRPQAGRPVWEMPPLDPGYLSRAKVFASIKLGSDKVSGRGFKEGDEIFNCLYAYLHPQSEYRDDPRVLARLRRLLEPRFAGYVAGENLNDLGSVFQAQYAYMMLKQHRPEVVADRAEAWDRGARNVAEHILNDRRLVFEDRVLGALWLMADIRFGMAVYFAGVAIGDREIQAQAAGAIDLLMPRAVIGDGGTHYLGFQNEVPTYHEVSIGYLAWWWTLTGSPTVGEAILKSLPYVPLSVEPSGFQEQSTAIPYDHKYNGIRGQHAALLKAYLTGDGYNYFFGREVEFNPKPAFALLLAVYHRRGLEAKSPPSGFVVHDRAIHGPRGRFENWGFVATGRDPQTPGPEHVFAGYQGAMCGKGTFVGAFMTGPPLKGGSLHAALDGVTVRVRHKPGLETDWQRGHKHRFLTQDERTSTLARPVFGTLAASYRLSDRRSATATPDWGPGTGWLGRQLWLMTPERIVGLVQVYAESEQRAYGLDTRAVLTTGRRNVSGVWRELVQPRPHAYRLGDLELRKHAASFRGPEAVERFGVMKHPEDDFSAQITWSDQRHEGPDTPTVYPAGTTRWTLLEVGPSDRGEARAVNLNPEDPVWAVLEVEAAEGLYRVIHNLSDHPQRYAAGFASKSGSVSLHAEWLKGGRRPLRVEDGRASIDLAVPAHGHAVVVDGPEPGSHRGETLYFEDVFDAASGARITP